MSKRQPTGKSNSSGRDQGGFVALPWSVLDCQAYRELSSNAKQILIEVARQYVRDNNGRLLLSMSYMRKRGWNSASMLDKGKKELIAWGFIFETVKGHRPNKASWYALTWYNLDKIKGYDPEAEGSFQRSAYKNSHLQKNDVLNPNAGTKKSSLAPSYGIYKPEAIPNVGAMKVQIYDSSIPTGGNHLDTPSILMN
jgi:hypothetical protein